MDDIAVSAFLGRMVGGLVVTFLLSRLMLWLLRSWNGGIQRLFVAHGVTLLFASFLAGMGMADGGAFAGAQAFMIYAPPQAVWLIVDIIRARSEKKAQDDKPVSQP